MITLQICILLFSRIFAKRKLRFKSKIKWLSVVDLILIQNTLDPLYLFSWILWCFFWDTYDRNCFGFSALIASTVTCARIVWALNEMKYVYFGCVFTSSCLIYASLYNFFNLG